MDSHLAGWVGWVVLHTREARCVNLTLATWWTPHCGVPGTVTKGASGLRGAGTASGEDVEPGMCESGPPVLRVLVPEDDSQGALTLWPCLLQSGETALHVAARYGHADVVQLLCSFGSNPNFQDKVGHGS